jgi:hypothetical protein
MNVSIKEWWDFAMIPEAITFPGIAGVVPSVGLCR